VSVRRFPVSPTVARTYAGGAIDLDRPRVEVDDEEAWSASLSPGVALGANIP
jgi:hypothetical protein